MSIASLPSPLQNLGGRRFSFYPPIRHIEHNQWIYRRATWSECVVANMRSGEEICIPRMFIDEVLRTDDPVVIVGLSRELEWTEGVIVPRQRRVIELPVAVNDMRPIGPVPHAEVRPARLAPVINIRLEPKPEMKVGKWVGVALVLGVAVCTIVLDIATQSPSNQRADFFRASRSYLQLSADDDYASIVRKLGKPSEDRTQTADGRVYRRLSFPARRFSIVLAGRTASESRYIGTLDMHGRTLDTARTADGFAREPALRYLPF
jgi:hypothetical protein